MGLVATWLSGIGLSDVVPKFKAAGITTPESLAQLEVEHFAGLGVNDPDDSRKLFFLVQRIKLAVNSNKKKQRPRDENDVPIEGHTGSVVSESSMTDLSETRTVSTDSGDPQPSNMIPFSPDRVDFTTEAVNDEEDHVQSRNDRLSRRSKRIASKTQVVPTSPARAKENRVTQNSLSSTRSPKSPRTPQRTEAGMLPRTNQEKKVEKTPKLPRTPQRTETGISPRSNHEKKVETQSLRNVGSGSSDDNDSWVDVEGDEDIVSEAPSGRKSIGQPGTRNSSGINGGRAVSNGDSDSTNNSKTAAKVAPVSRMQAPRARRLQSRLPNPTSKSTRTGKQLSAIPSEAPAPMSPLVDLSQAKLDEDIETAELPKKKKTKKKTNRRRRTLSGDSDSLDQLLQSEGSEMSDSESSRLESDSDSESLTGSVDKRLDLEFYMSESAGSDGVARKPKSGRRSLIVPRSGSRAKSIGGGGAAFIHGGTESDSFKTQIAHLREDTATEHELFSSSIAEGDSDYDMRIRVIVRKRPVSKSEQSLSGGIDVIHPLDYGEYGRILVYQPKTRVDLTKEVETVPFAFDNVYGEDSTNVGIYNRSIRNLIGPFFAGQWSTIFAYGQTGSGKTYTMMGSNMTGIVAGTSVHDESNLGLYYLAAQDVFEMLDRPQFSHLSISVSLFEIYGGKLYDLLNDRRQVKCLEDRGGKICFPGLSEHPVFEPEQLMELIEEGATKRSTGTTSRNADSSRSHAVLQLNLRKTVGRKNNVHHGRLTFIDLAGSERGADTNSASRATRLEGAEINTSLLALKEVIRALATGGSMTHIPFRGSKLTQVLKDSFVGKKSRCCMIACISPDIGNCEQTLNTLRYADRVKERDSESGALSSNYEQPTKVPRMELSGRPRGPPSIEATHTHSSGSSDSLYEGNPDEGFTGNDENEDPASGNNDFLSVSDTDTAVLDDLLTTSTDERNVEASGNTVNQTEKRRAGQALVAQHRSVMASMLSMVKDEMALVNTVDADRDGLDDYLVQLEEIQQTKLNLISRLRQALDEYVNAAEGGHQEIRERAGSDESFEDLRD